MTLAVKSRPMSHDRSDPEAVLLDRLRAGDEAAFEQLVRQHQESRVRFSHRPVGRLAAVSGFAALGD